MNSIGDRPPFFSRTVKTNVGRSLLFEQIQLPLSVTLALQPRRTHNHTINSTEKSANMNTLNANDLKLGGVTAIEVALQNETEVAISVRGERRFVVMSTAQYEHLRECELEAAWLTSQADRAAGRVRSMTAAQHIAEMQKHLQKPASTLTAQQERKAYQADKGRIAKGSTAKGNTSKGSAAKGSTAKGSTANARNARNAGAKPAPKAPRRKPAQAR